MGELLEPLLDSPLTSFIGMKNRLNKASTKSFYSSFPPTSLNYFGKLIQMTSSSSILYMKEQKNDVCVWLAVEPKSEYLI